MSEKVVFIDDEEASLYLYGRALKAIYGNEYDVITMTPGATIDEMLVSIGKVDEIVSIIIDEKLHVGIGADYKGSELADAIRSYDTKLPLYILTSETSSIDTPFGSVEYVIDKAKIGQQDYKNQYAILMRRHIGTFNDIKTQRSERFDFLLKKSLEEQLTEEELAEYKELDFIRVRKVMSAEEIVGSSALDEQQKVIEDIERKLKELRGEA